MTKCFEEFRQKLKEEGREENEPQIESLRGVCEVLSSWYDESSNAVFDDITLREDGTAVVSASFIVVDLSGEKIEQFRTAFDKASSLSVDSLLSGGIKITVTIDSVVQ